MHMADALVSPAVAATMYACSTVAGGYSIHKVKLENDPKRIPTMGVMGAFVFAAQMINFTIPGTGSSGHICGGLLLSAVLGPYAGFLTMIGVLMIQCLFFADGGLLALGCNIWNMAFYGCFIGASLIWRPIMKKGTSRARIFLASIIGCILTLQLGAFSVSIETVASGVTELPFTYFVSVMQPIHLAIGLVEGLITGVVLSFVYETRPELLWGTSDGPGNKWSLRQTIGAVAIAAAGTGSILSLFASSFPDGLEWSMERVAGTTELERGGGIYDIFASIQKRLSFLPDYALPGSDSAIGTTISGLVGALITVALCVGLCYALRLFLHQGASSDGQRQP